MKKKTIKILLILLIPLLLTGCYKSKHDYNFKISADNTIEFNFLYGASVSKEDSEEKIAPFIYYLNQLQEKGYQTSYSIDTNYSELTINKKFNLDKVLTTEELTNLNYMFYDMDNIKLLNIQRTNNSKIYTANWIWKYGTYVYNESENKFDFWCSDQGADDWDMGYIYPSLGNSFKVELPVKPLSSNASRTENNGKTLLWDLEDVGFNSIQFSFELPADTLIKLKTNKIKLLTEDIKEGDKVLLSIDKTIKKEDVLITDEDKNNIQFEINQDILSFTMPNKKVTIDIKEPKNPDTGYSYLLFSIIFLVIISSFIMMRRIKTKEE